jgi:hypothetical protein
MTGIEKFRATAAKIKADAEAEKTAGYKPMDVSGVHDGAKSGERAMPWEEGVPTPPDESAPKDPDNSVAVRVEHHGELAPVKSLGIVGLEDIGGEWLPVPYMNLVQLTTTAKFDDGTDAPRGVFFMRDTREVLDEPVSFVLLRAKSGTKTEVDGTVNPTMNLLGLLMPEARPFILSLTKGSFSSIRNLFGDLKRRKAPRAWYYGIQMTKEKGTNKSGQPFYYAKFEVSKDQQDDIAIAMLDGLFDDYAAALDRRSEQQAEGTPE